jgi:thiol-disulfide isomerase/thioredoxin
MWRIHPLYTYLNAEDLKGFKDFYSTLGEVTGTERIHFASAGFVRRAVAKGEDLDYARTLIEKERKWAKDKLKDAENAERLSQSEIEGRQYGYALFTNDYAKLLAKIGNDKRAFEMSKEALEYNKKRKDADITDFYLAMALKFLNEKEITNQLAILVKDEMATANVLNELKKLYISKNGRVEGYDKHLASLNGSHIDEKIKALKNEMLNKVAPDFSLKDLQGTTVNLKDLKGKIIVLDFWATWCGPCKASFPAMQAMVDKYKDNENVKFLFIDTYERGANKEKAANDYITEKGFSFQVLMDNSDEVAKSYGANNIPAKFVIDKNGNMQFKSAGFRNDADLMTEIEAMITTLEK